MGLVLWIDSNTFATGLLEKIFKKKNQSFYTLPSAEDFSYLVEDLKPELLVLDSKTAHESINSLKQQYEASSALQALPVIMIDEGEEIAFIEHKIGKINRPFDPYKIPEILQNILKSN